MSLEAKLVFASNFYSERAHFKPGHVPASLDGRRLEDGPRAFPEDPAFLWGLKKLEMTVLRTSILNTAEIDFVLRLAASQNNLGRIHHELGEVLRRDTNLLANYDEVNYLSRTTFVPSRHSSIKDAVRVNWATRQVPGKPEAGGRYYAGPMVVDIYHKRPSQRETIRQLATTGTQPYYTQVHSHEMLHALQYVFGQGRAIAELIEAQAHRIHQARIKQMSHEDLVQGVVGDPLYEHLEPAKFNAALWVVDRLNALGLTQEEVIVLINRPGVWNEGMGNWERLESAIASEMAGREMESEDLERELMAENLRHSIATNGARVITQRLLYLVYKRELDARRKETSEELQPPEIQTKAVSTLQYA
ncbi:hypothetical protein HY024_01160 [Candidatus Curtissbacteria bacterium]|nr:hypothetical protein [Candidatus Curtissbacteria bacterium]